MTQSDPAFKATLEQPELEYLVNKKKEDTGKLFKAFKILIILIIGICLAVGVVLFMMIRISPKTFIDRGEPNPDIVITCLKLMSMLLGAVIIAGCYSYFKTIRKVIKDITSGEKTIEPCLVIRKQYAPENNTYNLFVTSVIKYCVEVSQDDYGKLSEGDKINLEYSTLSKIFFGYSSVKK